MKIVNLLMCLMFLFNGPAVSAQAGKRSGAEPASNPAEIGREVRAVLDAQVAAWNRGDLEGFMKGYWKSSELTFISTGNVTKGWDETLARYKRRYQAEGRKMGLLTFDEVSVESLGPNAALVHGRWKLEIDDTTPGGRFTLIFKRFSDGWRIIHDHTS